MKCHERVSPQANVKGFKKCCMSNAVRLMMIYRGVTVNRFGMLGASVRKMKALTVKMDTVTLIGILAIYLVYRGVTVNRFGMLGASVRKMKALTVKMDTVTLIGKGR
jgi:hypothetical protein